MFLTGILDLIWKPSSDVVEGGVKFKAISLCDHNFSKHPLNKDFFNAKMTP